MREKWSSRSAFVLAAIGSAVGLGNAWRFPGLAAKYGGGAFLFVYLIAMVAFSSSIANQYLVIPMAALCVLNVSRWDIVYMLHNGLFLLVNGDGLYMYYRMRSYYQNNFLNSLVYYYDKEAYIIAAWILVFALLQLRKNAQNGKPILSCNCGIEMVGNST